MVVSMVRRRPWRTAAAVAALALLLAASASASTATGSTSTIVAATTRHRELLGFGAADGADASAVVAGLGERTDKSVDDLVNTLMDNIGSGEAAPKNDEVATGVTPTPTIAPTGAPTSTPVTTPPTSVETTTTPTPTGAPIGTPTVVPTPVTTPAISAETTTTTPTAAPTPASPADSVGPTKAEKTPIPTTVDSSTSDTGGNNSADGSGPELGQDELPTGSGAANEPTEENFVIPAATPAPVETPAPTPSLVPTNKDNVVVKPVMLTPTPTAVPTFAPTAVPTVVPSVTPVPVTPVVVNVADVVKVTTPAVADKAKAGIGQVHAPTYSGSLANAVSGVGKSTSEPDLPQLTKKHRQPPPPATGDDATETQSVESSSTSSGNMYSMGTVSILSIVGVIVGICAIVGIFVVINRKNYGADSSDDELPAAYGGYRIDGSSIARLSPTFLHNGDSSMVGSRVGAGAGTFDHDRTSSSGESGEEKVSYFGSSYGFDNYLAQNHPLAKSNNSNSGGTNGSALLASDLKMSIASSVMSSESESWSSVMESEQGTTSRCTRDTTLSTLTTTPHSDWDGSSRRMTMGADAMSDTSSNYRLTRASSRLSFGRDTVREESVASIAESGTSTFYRGSAASSVGRSTSYSEFTRSTDAGSSIYSLTSP